MWLLIHLPVTVSSEGDTSGKRQIFGPDFTIAINQVHAGKPMVE